MTLDTNTLLAILAMMAATVATRLGVCCWSTISP